MDSRVMQAPPVAELPSGRAFGDEFLRLREAAFGWIEDYYDREHMTRAADWMLALDPEAPEELVIAALLHDMERSVSGGPVLDKANTPWDDVAYNTAHTLRSAEIVGGWLADLGASEQFVDGVKQPIREHEFGGSPHGDLMQAVDSISFLEVNGRLISDWVLNGDCDLTKGQTKLLWMGDRVRLEWARPTAAAYCDAALADVDRRLSEARR